MGRRLNTDRREAVLKIIKQNDGRLKAAGVAKLLGVHPQEVSRVLTALEDEPEKALCEDDKGFLSRFKLG